MKELVTFVGEQGRKWATIFQVPKYVLPYKIEYFDNDEHLGNMFYVSEQEAELAAKKFTFGG